MLRVLKIIGLLGLGVTAALFPGRATAADKAQPPKQTTLRVWIMPNGPGDNRADFMGLVRPFTDAHPQLKVETTVIPWGEALGKIQEAVAGGPKPDLVQLGTTWVATFAATGSLLDLTGKFDEKPFPPQVLATTGIDGDPKSAGKRFAMPWLLDTRALYYNRELCAKAGINPKKDLATWDSFKAALKKLKHVKVKGKPVEPLGIPMANWNIIHNLSPWIWGAGGGFVPLNEKEPGIGSKETLEGIEYYAGLYRDGLVSAEADQADEARVAEMLRKGTVAITIAFPTQGLPPDRFGIAAVPAGPKGHFAFLGGSSIGVFESSKHQAEAVDLIRFLSTAAAQVDYSTRTGLLPAAAARPEELHGKLDPIRAAFVKQIQFGKSYPSIVGWGDIETVLRDGLNAVWSLDKAPGKFDTAAAQKKLDQMAKAIDQIVHPAGN
jgi:multiple sugar transport system substrate-binding protein